ncbi:MAG TPA: hypothetical protein VKG82_04630 [Solirubrobacteraceae bacterium]|nr:hypothetical protein [Solirubrobacteraceae bacterium]HME02487.1 hypothetical protein [Solirubrobacteraceae bacterium]
MRRASTCVAVLGLALLAMTGAAQAAPTVTLKAEAVPIPGFPHTGNIYSAGAAIKAEFTISGKEYGGFPPPLINVNFDLPKGAKIHPSGFPTCPTSDLEPAGMGPSACPKGSAAGPVGKFLGEVAFGKEIVPEEGTIESFYKPGGGLEFFTAGHSPVSLEILSKGHYVTGPAGFGPELISEVPLVETVPGAQDASVEKILVQAGSAIKSHGKTTYYGTLPKKGECPKGGFNIKAELTFAGLGGLTQVSVPVAYKAPCPRK